ncbi:VOC family protein [Nonomuraea recticatena]
MARLTALGARVVEYVEDWIVMADPEGNEFCLQGP